MKNINLLPKEPWVQLYYTPLLIGILSVSLSAAIGFTYLGIQIQSKIERNQSDLNDVKSRIIALNKEREIDPLTKEFTAFNDQLKAVKNARRDWPDVMKALTAAMPNASRMNSVQTAKDAALALQMDFSSLEEVTAYIVNVQALSFVEKVAVKQLSSADLSLPEVPTDNTGAGNAGSITTGGTQGTSTGGTSQPTSMSTEEYIASMQPSAKPGNQSEGDKLLEQLNQMVTNRLSQQVHGIPLPSETPVRSQSAPAKPTPAPSGALTQEDLDAAKKKLEEFKQIQVTDKPTSRTPGTAAGTGTGTGTVIPNPAAAASPAVKFYRVQIEIMLKPITSAKQG